MAFLNMKKVVFKNEYTMEELYEAVKDKEFVVGKPILANHGATKLVVFAPFNIDTQIVINPGKMGNKMDTFRVMILPEVGVANLILNTAITAVTDQWSLVLNSMGKDVKQYKKCVDVVAQELLDMGL